jgi:CheY-like chemotaxis protein
MVSSLLDTISITGKNANVKQALHHGEAGHRMTRATRGHPTSSTGREHDTTAVRTHTEILPALTATAVGDLRALGDLGYEGEFDTIMVAFNLPPLTGTQDCDMIRQQRSGGDQYDADSATPGDPRRGPQGERGVG